jgi:hypothetical protein
LHDAPTLLKQHQRRESQCDHNGEDRDDHEQLDEREGSST